MAGDPECTVDYLTDLLTEEGGIMPYPSRAVDEVYKALYIGDSRSAKNRFILERQGITHVLNTAQGEHGFHVKADPEFYEKLNIIYKGIEASDEMGFRLDQFFEETANFIEDALSKNGRVLVHCREGVSRSSTIVLAFLMLKRHMTAPDAVRTVRSKREVSPNDGFLQILCDLNKRLQRENHFTKTET